MHLYFVLNIPAPFSERVMKLRRSQKDNFFTSLPVEVTIAGSTGVGVLESSQNLPEAYALLDRLAEDTAPIETSFGPVVRYPGTDIFALTLENEAPFHALHQRLVQTGIKFRESPHPFRPHCTLRSGAPVSLADERALLGARIPGKFVLDAISVCRLDRPPVALLHTAELARKAA
jgi:2'-5' RNA ligase